MQITWWFSPWLLAEVHRPIKQADAVMLIYPLNWNYSYDIMKNDLELYESLTDTSTSALTWSWFTIGWKWVNEPAKARSYFLKSYKDYLIQPFKVTNLYSFYSDYSYLKPLLFVPSKAVILD